MPELAMPKKRAEWTTVALGDVVDIINEHWDRDATVPERLVAGEHIDEGDLRVRRWAMTDDDLIPPTFNRRFRTGDVLLHSRNIRKVAQPDFGGITGEKLFILRSKNESVLLQSLVPFIVQSNVFRRYATSRWAGSTNKFLNKKPLAEFEFALPPVSEQERLARLLRSIEHAFVSLDNLLTSLTIVEASLSEVWAADDSLRTPLGEVLLSSTYGSSKKSNAQGAGVPILGIPNVRRGRLSLEEVNYVELPEAEVDRYRVDEGNILFVRTNGNPEYVGRCVYVPALRQCHVYASYLIRLCVDQDRLIPEFAASMINAPRTRRELRGVARSSAGNYNINTTELEQQRVPIPSLAVQRKVVGRLSELVDSQDAVMDRIQTIRQYKQAALGSLL